MYTIKLIEHNLFGYDSPAYLWSCPFCFVTCGYDLDQEYAGRKVRQHLVDSHNVDPSLLEIEVVVHKTVVEYQNQTDKIIVLCDRCNLPWDERHEKYVGKSSWWSHWKMKREDKKK